MESEIVKVLFNQETIFFGLFLYLFWTQQQEKKGQNAFLLKQQDILGEMANSLKDLKNSFGKLAENQEKLTERIEKIETKVGGDNNE